MYELSEYAKGLLDNNKDNKPIPLEKGGITYNLRTLSQEQMARLYKDGNSLIQKIEPTPSKKEKFRKEPPVEDPPEFSDVGL